MSGWQDISTAPSQEDLLVCKAGYSGWWVIASKTLGEWRVAEGYDRIRHEPTHWMYPPTPPEPTP